MAVVAGGAICGIGMFNALMMSYTRLPMAMAEDGMLPRVVARRNSRDVPWVSVLLCGLGMGPRAQADIRAAHLHRPHSLRLKPAARVRRAGRAAHSRAATSPGPSRPAISPLPVLWESVRRRSSATRSTPRAEKRSHGHSSVSALLFAVAVGSARSGALLAHRRPLARRRLAAASAD